MSSGNRAKDEISRSARSCLELFAEALAQRGHTYVSRWLVNDYQGRFEIWIDNNRVFVDGKLSLDYRVRNDLVTKWLVLQHLHVLRGNLQAASEVAKIMSHDEPADDDSVQIFSRLSAALGSIKGALGQLYRLGTVIRESTAGQLMPRITSLSNDDPVGSFERLAYHLIVTLYPGANPRLLSHISASLAERYQVILDRHSRDKQSHVLPSQDNSFDLPVYPELLHREETQSDLTNSPILESHRSKAETSRVQPTIISFGSDKQEPKNQDTQKQKTPATLPPPQVASIHTSRVATYPLPQTIPDDAEYAKCEWCLESHPISLFKTSSEWRRHMQKDWYPFICLSEYCANLTPVPSFSKFHDWEQHMRVQHGDNWSQTVYKPPTWVCNLDHSDKDKPGLLFFPTHSGLADHVRESHDGITSEEIHRMRRYSVMSLSRAADVCPLCCYTIEDDSKPKDLAADIAHKATTFNIVTSKGLYDISEPENSSIAASSTRMSSHIARHLDNYTSLMVRLLSLPDINNDTECGEESMKLSGCVSCTWDESSCRDRILFEESDDEQPKLTTPGRSVQTTSLNTSKTENSGGLTAELSETTAADLEVKQVANKEYLLLSRNSELSLLSQEFVDNKRREEPLDAVAIFLSSLTQIDQIESHASVILHFVSCIEPKAIPESILPRRQAREKMGSAIRTLCSLGFLVEQRQNVFDVNSFVHKALQVWEQTQHKDHETKISALQHLSFICPSNKIEHMSRWREYLPHVRYALGITKEPQYRNAARFDLCYRVGNFLYADRRAKEAAWFLEEIYGWDDFSLLKDKDDRLAVEHPLAKCYLRDRKFKEAIKILNRIVEAERTMLAETDSVRIASERELARAYIEDGQTEEGIKILERLTKVENGHGLEDDGRFESKRLLASAYIDIKKISMAIVLLERIVTVQRRKLAETDPARLRSESTLARAYINARMTEPAIQILRRLVETWSTTVEQNSPDFLASEQLRAYIYLDNGPPYEAIRALERIKATPEKTSTENNIERLAFENKCPFACIDSTRFEEATAMLKGVLYMERSLE
ncbi:hypothetical protein F4777DRAFT_571592 [Nemania sp. FL0916]|nr:hypothetical protein F4777DRAFT_571592 [Nemania sp. FL0916]